MCLPSCLGEMTACCHKHIFMLHVVLTEPANRWRTGYVSVTRWLVRRHLDEGQGLNAGARDKTALPEALHERRALLLPQHASSVVQAACMS